MSFSHLTSGMQAPDFSLPDQMGALRSLSDFRNKKIALYFYPKDETPGCTTQACSLRDGFQDLTKAGIIILGVSFDSPESHLAFKKHHNLPFILLSDRNKEVAKQYGVKGLGGLYAQRVTFLIDEQGIIVSIIKDVDLHLHTQQILDGFAHS